MNSKPSHKGFLTKQDVESFRDGRVKVELGLYGDTYVGWYKKIEMYTDPKAKGDKKTQLTKLTFNFKLLVRTRKTKVDFTDRTCVIQKTRNRSMSFDIHDAVIEFHEKLLNRKRAGAGEILVNVLSITRGDECIRLVSRVPKFKEPEPARQLAA